MNEIKGCDVYRAFVFVRANRILFDVAKRSHHRREELFEPFDVIRVLGGVLESHAVVRKCDNELQTVRSYPDYVTVKDILFGLHDGIWRWRDICLVRMLFWDTNLYQWAFHYYSLNLTRTISQSKVNADSAFKFIKSQFVKFFSGSGELLPGRQKCHVGSSLDIFHSHFWR